MRFHLLTIFPSIFDSYFNESIIKRAGANGLISIQTHNLRDWATGKHRSVDDSPYGGGAGMIMRADIIYQAWKSITNGQNPISSPGQDGKKINGQKGMRKNLKSKTILFSAKGRPWTQTLARQYAELDNIIMVCGRYEGIDERVNRFADEEISIGPYVLTGGELPAMIVVDSIARLIPGVLSNQESLAEESYNNKIGNCELKTVNYYEYPQFTRPEVLEICGKKCRVPEILLSGDHKKIADWRKNKVRSKK